MHKKQAIIIASALVIVAATAYTISRMSAMPSANQPVPVGVNGAPSDGGTTPPPSQPASVLFGATVTLQVGATATFEDGLKVHLSKIDDSRCPPDVQCIWAGELAPTLVLTGGAFGGEPKELQLGTSRAMKVPFGGYTFELKGATEASATLEVAKGSGTAGGSHDDLIRVTYPQPDQVVMSPLIVTGEARGTWYFEASFPVTLLDANGKVVVAHYAQADADWMTPEFVPFTAMIEFEQPPATATGTLVLTKDNPSGLPEHDDEIRIPVRFAAAAPGQPWRACRKTGCSGQICAEENMVSDCMFRPEYACYRTATCSRQSDGKCGWTQTNALKQCLQNPPAE